MSEWFSSLSPTPGNRRRHASLYNSQRRNPVWLGRVLLFCMSLLGAALLTACGAEPAPDPVAENVAAPQNTPAAATTPDVAPDSPPTILEFWTSDTEAVRIAVYEAVAQRFMAEHPHIDVRIVPVAESDVSFQLMEAADQNLLPALVRVGVERLAPLAAAGIVDEDAAAAVIDAVGRDDFRTRPLDMARNPATGEAMGVPFDGWLQAIWYRSDLFGRAGLAAPVTWEQIDTACDALVDA
ncbi:MAG: ABC transporter substrate-binding protein, partial [Litorilinea sp.]